MSSKLELINPPELGKHPGYSQAVKVQTDTLVFVSGQVGWDEQGRFVSTEFAPQFARALANVLAVVHAAGGSPHSVVRMTLYVLDRAEYLAARQQIGAAWREKMGTHYPAMTLVEVKGLLEPEARLELEATAAL
jgi:enamine deaminase RidA (YjgF/YER057c/UK114 family)